MVIIVGSNGFEKTYQSSNMYIENFKECEVFGDRLVKTIEKDLKAFAPDFQIEDLQYACFQR